MTMNISIKSKLYLVLGFLVSFVVLLWISGSVFINMLAENSGAIIQDNIRTVSYAQQLEQFLNDLYTMQVSAIGQAGNDQPLDWEAYRQVQQQFEQILAKQENNLTEPGEGELTRQLRNNYRNLAQTFRQALDSLELSTGFFNTNITPAYRRLQQDLSQLTTMNMDAIHRKNDIAQQTATNVTIYMSIIGALCSILGMVMLIKFPSYIAGPVHELTRRIKEVSRRKYDHKLEFHTGDEYEELATAFNQMARKLQEYENSSLDRLMREKKRVEAIINHINDAVIGLDAEHYILFANNKAIELLERDKEELIGQYAPDVASSNTLLHKMLHKLSVTGQGSEEEQENTYLKINHDDEHYYTIETIPIPLHSLKGKESDSHLGSIITLKNVTRFHELDQAKTRFISVVSHELKTPLSSMNMSLNLLEDERIGDLNEEQQQLSSSIRKDVMRMKRTTRELLDLSKIETGNIQLNITHIRPAELLEYAFETMVIQASQKEVEMQLDIEENLPAVKTDSQKTVWVLVNLISNALRYTDPGGTVILKARGYEDPEYILFAVEDTGKGIKQDYLDKIFEKYFQVDRAEKDQSGSGLGLSIAKEFITALNGTIWAESEPEHGSTFHFTLPKEQRAS